MFAKLLKYEWKSTSAILGILSLCALGAGVLGGGVMRFIVYCTEQVDAGHTQFVALLSMSMFLLTGLFLALMAYVAGSQIMLFYRFYKSRFTDEGYLTFTLPVTAAQVFWSSFLVILGWSLISALVMLLDVVMFVALGTLGTQIQIDADTIKEMFYIWDVILEETGTDLIVSLIVSLVSFLASILYYMTAITVGSIIAKKHKLLAAIGVYIGASMVLNMITGTLTTFSVFLDTENAIAFIQTVEIIFSLAMASGACALNIHLMKNKLNLP